MVISVIIPTLNEEKSIVKTLMPLQAWRARGHEVILVDAGSDDSTVSQTENLVDKCCYADKGRANQMNKGAEQADGDILLFLHADTLIGDDADRFIINSLKHFRWGRFKVRFSSSRPVFKLIAYMMNVRSCWSSVATGDQAIYVEKMLFTEMTGFPQLPIMEDVQFSKNLNKRNRMDCLEHEVMTSSRRWEQNGVIKTIILMWGLRLAYFLGVSAARLKSWYR